MKSVCTVCEDKYYMQELVQLDEKKDDTIYSSLVCMDCFQNHDCTGSREDGCQTCQQYYNAL